MKYIKHDGGRSKYFKKGKVGDCVVRAIALALEQDYKVTYYELMSLAMPEGLCYSDDFVWKKYLKSKGWAEHKFGKEAKLLWRTQLSPHLNFIAHTPTHLSCVKGGVLYDTWNCSRKRCWRVWYDNNIINKFMEDDERDVGICAGLDSYILREVA